LTQAWRMTLRSSALRFRAVHRSFQHGSGRFIDRSNTVPGGSSIVPTRFQAVHQSFQHGSGRFIDRSNTVPGGSSIVPTGFQAYRLSGAIISA
jgi:hypothetical protein